VLRDEHDLALDRTIGLVRAAYPRDRTIQRVIFPPTVRAASDELEDGGDEEDSADTETG
jgi:hypothetical protein